MASNFAFAPMSQTSVFTVTPTPITATFWLAGITLTSGNMAPSGIRIGNVGTVVAFIQFGVPNQAITVSVGISMPSFPNTVETFATKGQNAIGMVSSGTATVYITPGEGL
jgi:hypothetical protein